MYWSFVEQPPLGLTNLLANRTDVLLHWATWPYLIACLSGLQSINGLSTWGATIIQSLGFSSINANLLNAPGPILAGIFGLVLSSFVDRYKRFGYAILFSGFWTLAGLVALYVSLHPPLEGLIRSTGYEQSLIVLCRPEFRTYQ